MYCKDQISLILSLSFLSACCLGCSGSGTEVELEKVTGVVTMDGKPLANAIVVFTPEEGNPSTAQTDETGKYELAHRGNAMGAIPGRHKVRITTGQPPAPEIDPDADMSDLDPEAEAGFEEVGFEEMDSSKGKTKKDPIPAKYNSDTTLTAEVKQGENTIDFKLESK
ncbi:carboxypeptidase-like regulatory domain-containing protein [Gimesia sp.]|uniref:carboxypeptidase-like regulatory domain-containing protein n=1 Tax=Gimesia sp. TaxID=2024833 RepID=UPI003A93DDB3